MINNFNAEQARKNKQAQIFDYDKELQAILEKMEEFSKTQSDNSVEFFYDRHFLDKTGIIKLSDELKGRGFIFESDLTYNGEKVYLKISY